MKTKMIIKRAALLLTFSSMAAFNTIAANYTGLGTSATSAATDTDWNDADNWSSGTAPYASNETYTFGPSWRATLTLSTALAPFGHFTITNSSTLTVNDGAYIHLSTNGSGTNGEFRLQETSSVIQNGGVIKAGRFLLGSNNASHYILNGGLLEITGGDNRIQSGGVGSTFTQTGGTANFLGYIRVGVDSGANNVIFNQTGGLFKVTDFYLGFNGGGGAYGPSYLLAGTGTLEVGGQFRVGPESGQASTTLFQQGGASVFRATTLTVGIGSNFWGNTVNTGRGYYTLSDQGLATVAQDLSLGTYGAAGILTLGGGTLNIGRALNAGNGYANFTGAYEGGDNSRFFARASGTVNQTGGVLNIASDSANVSANLGISGGAADYNLSGGVLNVSAPNNDATLTVGNGIATLSDAALPVYVNTSGANYEQRAAGTYYVASEGRFAQTGGTVAGSGNFNVTVGNDGGRGVYDLSGGLLSAKTLTVGSGQSGGLISSGSVNVSGGEVALTGNLVLGSGNSGGQRASGQLVQSGGTVSVSGALQLGSGTAAWELRGGLFVAGAGGITKDSAGEAGVLFTGGTVGSSSAWSSAVGLTLGDAHGGVTFDTTGGNITLSGALDGGGNFTKAGGGTLLLSGANTYSGDAIVSAGALQVDDTLTLGTLTLALDGSLTGSGNVTFATLNIDTSSSAGGAGWQLIDLTGGLTLSAFTVSGYTETSAGIWSNGAFEFDSGSGYLSVIPEPSTWALLLTSAALLAVVRRRK